MDEKEIVRVDELMKNESEFDTQLAIFKVKKDVAESQNLVMLMIAYQQMIECIEHLKDIYEEREGDDNE